MISRKNRVRFRRTDKMGLLVKKVIKDLYSSKGVHLNKIGLRKKKTQLLVDIENGIKEISMADIKATKQRKT